MTGSAPGQHDGTRFQQRSRARTSVQLLLTVTALCWSASDARRTALSKHVSAAAVRRASLADQHSVVTVRSSWRLLYGQVTGAAGSSCRRAGLERFQASAEHKSHIDQHQRDAGKARGPTTATSIHKLGLQQPLKRLKRV